MVVRILLLVLVSLGSVYVGTAGWAKLSLIRDEAALVKELATTRPSGPPVVYEGVVLRDVDTLKQVLNQEMARGIWPWLQRVPASACLLLASFGFGGFGGSCSLVAKHHLKKRSFDLSTGLRTVAFGSVLGLMLGLLSFLLPQVFTVQETVILRPEAVAATCFFGGVFQESTYVWIEKRVQDFFGTLGRASSESEPAPNADEQSQEP